jgi:hypothetical protein
VPAVQRSNTATPSGPATPRRPQQAPSVRSGDLERPHDIIPAEKVVALPDAAGFCILQSEHRDVLRCSGRKRRERAFGLVKEHFDDIDAEFAVTDCVLACGFGELATCCLPMRPPLLKVTMPTGG